MSSFDEKVLDFLICPKTGSTLLYDKKNFDTKDNKYTYQVKNGIINLFVK